MFPLLVTGEHSYRHSALCSPHSDWARRVARAAGREQHEPSDGCSRCSAAFRRRTHVESQRRMAAELLEGRRMLVRREPSASANAWLEQPTERVEQAAADALQQAAEVEWSGRASARA